ncbi:hypothetical protein C2845_PM17G06390 [Panicum miliaceum]|uniref:Uncharacterized protein n=1 Tax=Panicum miliaceum TaxID=4540 RepID=A0A3L6Q3Q8_PANMI|nr:hypothetical protein C2845_PM17G06390 [Panicum miliaceum]
MAKVDTTFRSVVFSSGERVTIFPDDVTKILGLPSRGKLVWDASLDKSNDMREGIRKKIDLCSDDEPPSIAAERILKELGPDLTRMEEESFVTAFTVYVVFYFDNLEFKGEIQRPFGLPRVKFYDSCTISGLVMADTNGLRGSPPTRVFGTGKVRQADEVVYRRNACRGRNPTSRCDSKQTQEDSRTTNTKRIRNPNEGQLRLEHTTSNTKQDTAVLSIIAARKHRARCIKHLSAARHAIEKDTMELVDTITRICYTGGIYTPPSINFESPRTPAATCNQGSNWDNVMNSTPNQHCDQLPFDIATTDLFPYPQTPAAETPKPHVTNQHNNPPRKSRKQ